jgi:hypothetical protein
VTGTKFIERFERGLEPNDEFHHADHVRLAFAYLCEYPVLRALEKFASALKRFAATRGKPQLYNESITCAYFFLIRERMARCEGADWEEFARRNPDLLVWKDGVLSCYYREGTLQSDLAREVFLLPDKCLELQSGGGSFAGSGEMLPRSARRDPSASPRAGSRGGRPHTSA